MRTDAPHVVIVNAYIFILSVCLFVGGGDDDGGSGDDVMVTWVTVMAVKSSWYKVCSWGYLELHTVNLEDPICFSNILK